MRLAQAEFAELIKAPNATTPDHVSIGFGSREILNKAALMNGIDNGELISPQLTFEAINRYAQNTMKSKVVRVPMDSNIGIDLDAMASAITSKTNMI